LVRHYSFSNEELDFSVNHHIKYRMGRDGGEEITLAMEETKNDACGRNQLRGIPGTMAHGRY
jgi:hypothetical protein